jgi:hypothetical protein
VDIYGARHIATVLTGWFRITIADVYPAFLIGPIYCHREPRWISISHLQTLLNYPARLKPVSFDSTKSRSLRIEQSDRFLRCWSRDSTLVHSCHSYRTQGAPRYRCARCGHKRACVSA